MEERRRVSNQSRGEFESMIAANFKLPEDAFLTRNDEGYYNGHLNAYYKVYKLCKQQQAAKVESLKHNLISIVLNVVERKPSASMAAVAKQICIDVRAYLDDLK